MKKIKTVRQSAKESVVKAEKWKLPKLTLMATGGKSVNLTDYKDSILVLYFYPKDATPGCTLEGQDFSKLYARFKKCGAEVFGVSRDSLRSHENFKLKQKYSIDLLSDPDEELCLALDVMKMKNMYGRQVRGIERSTFVFGPGGRLLQVWRGVKVKDHAQAVLDFVAQI